MNQLFLAKPEDKYRISFKRYVMSYKNAGDTYYYDKYKLGIEDFTHYVDLLTKMSLGQDIKIDEVQTSSFWLISDGEVVGVVRVRHKELDNAGHIGYDISPDYRNRGFGNSILRLALEKARSIGIEGAILTCKVSNIPSSKIIVNNGGKLLGKIYDEEDDADYFKYIIDIK